MELLEQEAVYRIAANRVFLNTVRGPEGRKLFLGGRPDTMILIVFVVLRLVSKAGGIFSEILDRGPEGRNSFLSIHERIRATLDAVRAWMESLKLQFLCGLTFVFFCTKKIQNCILILRIRNLLVWRFELLYPYNFLIKWNSAKRKN